MIAYISLIHREAQLYVLAIIKFVYLNSNKEIIRPGVNGNIIFVSC